MGHHVDERGITHPRPPSQLMQDMGSVRHRLHSAGHHEVRLVEADRPCGHPDGRHPGQAHLVDGDTRNRHGQTAAHCGLSRRYLAFARLEHLPEDHLVDGSGLHPGPFGGRSDRRSTQVDRPERAQTTPVLPDRGASRTDDDSVFRHGAETTDAPRVTLHASRHTRQFPKGALVGRNLNRGQRSQHRQACRAD